MKARPYAPLLALVFLIAGWGPADAQERPGSIFPPAGSEVRGQIRSGAGDTPFEGFLVSSSPSELEIRTLESESIRVESAALAVLEVKRRSGGAGADKGWKIGALVTGTLLAFMAAGEADNKALGFVFGGVIGAIPGALVGGLVGAAVGADSWERVW